jgi:hypothetical protein
MIVSLTRLSLIAAGLVLASLPAQSETVPAFADGKPWKAKTSDGEALNITFNADGSGRMKAGIMSVSMSWEQEGNKTCIIATPIGRECIAFKSVAGGYDGKGKSKSLTLRR